MTTERVSEQKNGIWGKFGKIVREFAVSGVRKRRLETEEGRRMAEQAKVDLELAFMSLGGKTGTEVSRAQICDVLLAEQQVLLHAPFDSNACMDARYMLLGFAKDITDMHDPMVLWGANALLVNKSVFWSVFASEQREKDPNSEIAVEADRRAIACHSASMLLLSQGLL